MYHPHMRREIGLAIALQLGWLMPGCVPSLPPRDDSGQGKRQQQVQQLPGVVSVTLSDRGAVVVADNPMPDLAAQVATLTGLAPSAVHISRALRPTAPQQASTTPALRALRISMTWLLGVIALMAAAVAWRTRPAQRE
jgi:NAD/NADP transhydrogenase beta subunit